MASSRQGSARVRKSAALERLSLFVRPALRVTSAGWSKLQDEYVLDAFHSAAKHVPAYRKFLKLQGIVPRDVKTAKDLLRVPPVGKKNYLRAYHWKDLCVKNAIDSQSLVLTATSGSTGKSFYFPRTNVIDEQSYIYHRGFLDRSVLDPDEPTLVIVGFGMGVWIGGIITYEAFKRISERDFPLTVLTAGVNKKEIYDSLREIGEHYTQLVLCGYPPFIKDVIDDGPGNGISWKQFDIRVVCAAEGFSEEFRHYLMEQTGMRDPYRSVMNIYGSAELGTMATETPLSILVRELALKNEDLFSDLFNEATRLPTVAQYIPSFVSFDAVDNRVYCTAGTALPLIRYEIGDHGGVATYAHVKRVCAEHGIDLKSEIKKAGIADVVQELPFVYVYERADLSTKLYGAIIFPEHVKHGLMNRKLQPSVTGKFTMETKFDENQNEYLEVNVELKAGVRLDKTLEEIVAHAIDESLSERSAEHKNNRSAMGERVRPRVVLWPYGDKHYFAAGTKHKWVRK
jgi:phenylacetate-CoA ligase